jgi:long-subunit fatty acid transport protein
MNKTIIRPFFLIILLAMGFQTFSQIEDFQLWNGYSVEKELNKKISVGLEQEFRFKNNASQFEDYLTTLGGGYKINKYLKVRGAYRFNYAKSIEEGVKNEHRFNVDLMLRYKLDRFVLGYRARYQVEYEKFEYNHYHDLRNKFGVKYNIRKTDFVPFAEYEFNYSLNYPAGNSIYRNRYTFGVDYEISKQLSVYSYYRIQTRRIYDKKPYNYYILGLGANYTF